MPALAAWLTVSWFVAFAEIKVVVMLAAAAALVAVRLQCPEAVIPGTVRLSETPLVVTREADKITLAVPSAVAEVFTQVLPEVEPNILMEHFVPAFGAASIRTPSHSVIVDPTPTVGVATCTPVFSVCVYAADAVSARAIIADPSIVDADVV